jgi:hypothetical protein
MERDTKASHAFLFTNAGNYPLMLAQGDTTCKCTISKLKDDEVAPGESVEVVLEWESKTGGPQFRQSATILTNDPQRQRVNLTVEGVVSSSVVVEPADVIFSRISPGESKTARVRVLCFTQPNLEIVEHQFQNPSTADYFEMSWEPLSAEMLGDSRAQSGALLSITIKPGLPAGGVRQVLDMTTNVAARSQIAIPIQGRIAGDVAIFGSGWNSNSGILSLGSVERGVGIERKLRVIVSSSEPGEEQAKLRVAKVSPDVLEVELGEAEPVGASRMMTPLVVRVPAGAPIISRFGPEPSRLGEIVLESDKPGTPRIQLYVRFAVVE